MLLKFCLPVTILPLTTQSSTALSLLCGARAAWPQETAPTVQRAGQGHRCPAWDTWRSTSDTPLPSLCHSKRPSMCQSNREVPEWSLSATGICISLRHTVKIHLSNLEKQILPSSPSSSSELLTNAAVQRYEHGCPNNVSL